MYQNVIFKGIGTYHPANQVDNSYYVDYFKDIGIEVSHLITHLGRETRYVANDQETTVTMAYEASLEAMKSASIQPEDIDLLIFGTDCPESLVPTNALLLHDKLKTVNANQIFDLNSNCIGMLSAIDVASRLLLSNPRLNKALVVGSFMGSFISSKTDPVCYSNMADAAAAIILEKVEEPQRRGFIDTNFKTDPSVKDAWIYPIGGFKQILNNDIDKEEKKLKLKPFDTSFICQEWVDLMDTLFDRCDVSKYSISQYFFSQFSKPDAERTLELMNIDLDRYTFTGNKYGYTGLTSPILAYYEALHNGKVKSGDNIMFCSVGAGFNICALLYKI